MSVPCKTNSRKFSRNLNWLSNFTVKKDSVYSGTPKVKICYFQEEMMGKFVFET